MTLPPRPKRKDPKGCMVLLLVMPLAGLAYGLSASAAFDLLEAFYWAAVMAAAVSGLLAIRGEGGNLASWPIVASAYVAAGLDWQGVPFDPWLWRLIDVAAVAGIVGLRRGKLRWSDWLIFALFLPAWWAYERSDYVAYVVSAAAVIAQCAVAVAVGLDARTKAAASPSAAER